MLVSQIKIKFHDQLKKEYPSGEIQSFFNLLTEAYLKMSRLDLALDHRRELSASEEKKFEDALLQLLKHEPIQYILGETEFFGLKFKVNKNVLIPRPETEDLVQWILEDLKSSKSGELSILDIGTGSGCIAISLAKKLPKARVSAIDISKSALKVASANAKMNGVEVAFILQDILKTTVLQENYDLIVSNPPYVRELEKKEMHRNVLENEPEMALYVKDLEPLIFYQKITKLAETGLKQGGSLYFEINQYLGKETAEVLNSGGFKSFSGKDIFGNDRMLKGTKESRT
ncbi:peptide chain release factor N(5)-glutamine methyltransferase [Gillisia limnaea]|uniref:Release factor glutamine methyltransferase n=1 Tax=Gillisia limnaea (strain DSM 15749 / LMG 21470 / R-8282) TaxID=865937 RepID=H2BWJ5_GILLR|nr:peptide chain release factor N(5)-glutamine methyltransferase [Gillisia limnaea]EHQ01938.1 protein-(glutamine-N5) methyltransferase, release factor-specific [Gillisia limnaea DSM 15749]